MRRVLRLQGPVPLAQQREPVGQNRRQVDHAPVRRRRRQPEVAEQGAQTRHAGRHVLGVGREGAPALHGGQRRLHLTLALAGVHPAGGKPAQLGPAPRPVAVVRPCKGGLPLVPLQRDRPWRARPEEPIEVQGQQPDRQRTRLLPVPPFGQQHRHGLGFGQVGPAVLTQEALHQGRGGLVGCRQRPLAAPPQGHRQPRLRRVDHPQRQFVAHRRPQVLEQGEARRRRPGAGLELVGG